MLKLAQSVGYLETPAERDACFLELLGTGGLFSKIAVPASQLVKSLREYEPGFPAETVCSPTG